MHESAHISTILIFKCSRNIYIYFKRKDTSHRSNLPSNHGKLKPITQTLETSWVSSLAYLNLFEIVITQDKLD
jgi:hypothetical protein